MRIVFHAAIILSAAGLGFTTGYILRGKSSAMPAALRYTPARPLDEARTNSYRAARKITVTRAHDDSPLATQLERDLSMSAGVTRWLYWLEGVEKAELKDFARLARLAHGNPTATRLLAGRWVERDLSHLFNTIATVEEPRGFPVDVLADVLFDEWLRRDPEAAIAALGGTNRFGTRDAWRLTVADYLVETDPERGLRVLSEWGIDNFAPAMAGVARWAAANPRRAAETALANPAGHASLRALDVIGREWARTEPAQALAFAAAHPGELGSTLAQQVLRHWAERNLRDTAQWLSVADPATRNQLSPAFVETWAKSDAAGAVAWCEANLAGPGLARAVGGALKGAAQRDVVKAADLVAGMQPSPARAEAAAAIALAWFPGSLSGKRVPRAALEWMASLDPDSSKRALENVQWKWSINDPRSMAAFLTTASTDKVPRSADANLARALARQNPAEALAWAHRLPAERGVAAGGIAFAEWRRVQPESAMKWLEALPASDRRRASFSVSAVR